MINYPDVLGYITQSERYTFGVIEAALAVRPRVAKSGHPFGVILLLQNTINTVVDVTATLSLPNKDAAGKKDRFIVDKPRLVVQLQPGEVGYVLLPVSSLPDTATSRDYTLSMDVQVKPAEKAELVRQADTPWPLDTSKLPAEKAEKVESLRKCKFSTQPKKGGLLRGASGLEIGFAMLAGKTGKPLKLKPGWVSLWTLGDQDDVESLLVRYREPLKLKLLPGLDRKELQANLLEKTTARFAQAGYPLQPIEALTITKLMLLILEYANPSQSAQSTMQSGAYNLEQYLREDVEPQGELPFWVRRILRAIAQDERVARAPNRAIPHFAYDDLLKDATLYGFKEVERASGEELGTAAEMLTYADHLLEKLGQQGTLDFGYVYVPLVLAGVIVYDRVLLKDEQVAEIVDDIRDMLEQRRDEVEEDDPVFALAENVIEYELRKYGSFGHQR